MYELTQVREVINGVFKGYKELKFTHHRDFDVWVFVPSERVNKCWAFWSLEQRKRLVTEQVPITCRYRKKTEEEREFFFFIEQGGSMLINDFFHEITSILPNKAILHHKSLPRKLKKLGYNIVQYEIYYGEFDDL